MRIAIRITTILLLIVNYSCKNGNDNFDASGTFESVETIVSTEASGTLMQFSVDEGQALNQGQQIGYVDSTQLHLKKQQIQLQIISTLSQQPDIALQIASLQAQLADAEKNQFRMTNLFKENAITGQQMDEANTRVEVIQKQIEAQKSSLGITSNTISKNVAPLEKQIEQLNDQLKKCILVNPVSGTVLTKYSENHEVVNPGKALYKIAQTDSLILRAYILGSQLTQIKLGQSVTVRTDDGVKKYRTYSGIIFWISDKSEFTPKTIPTKDERADLVYAIKIRVPNDGYLKIGMYGEVKF